MDKYAEALGLTVSLLCMCVLCVSGKMNTPLLLRLVVAEREGKKRNLTAWALDSHGHDPCGQCCFLSDHAEVIALTTVVMTV